MRMKFPSGGMKERTRSDSQRLNRTHGWKLTSSRRRGFCRKHKSKWIFNLGRHTFRMHTFITKHDYSHKFHWNKVYWTQCVQLLNDEEINAPWRTESSQASHWDSHRLQLLPESLQILWYLKKTDWERCKHVWRVIRSDQNKFFIYIIFHCRG